jgi:dihydroorotase-like cyclic amidohydrolase
MSQGPMVTSDDYATGSRSAACGGVTTYIDAEGGLYTFAPTMQEAADSEALWAGIRSGDVTYAGSDHSPFDRAVKLGAPTFDADLVATLSRGEAAAMGAH